MYIEEVDDLQLWEDFAIKLNLNTFLHSTNWAKFSQKNSKVWQFGMFNLAKELVSIALIIKVSAKRGQFLFCPHGPQSLSIRSITHNLENSPNLEEYKTEMRIWLEYLQDLAKNESCSFIRIQPILDDNENSKKIFDNLQFSTSPIHTYNESSTVLDIDKPIEDVLAAMNATHRRRIRQGLALMEKGDVTVHEYKELDNELYKVYTSTTKRGNFVGYNIDYLNDELKIFSDTNNAKLIAIKHKNQVYSWGMFLFVGQRAFYHHGANILTKDVPASYLCHYQGIKLAKEYGCISYDFWGVAPKDQPNHPWVNISIFKKRFGGFNVDRLPSQDYIISPKYWFTWVIETYRAKKRGFR